MTLPLNTASLMPDNVCSCCGWPVVHCCANDGMDKWRCDYVIYCSNKSCENHAGSGMFLDDWPEWLQHVKQ